MKICKVKVNKIICESCLAIQEELQSHSECSRCKLNNKEYELLNIVSSGSNEAYAVVKSGNITEYYPTDYIYDIREK